MDDDVVNDMHPSIKRAYETLERIERRETEWAIEAAQRDPNAPDALEHWNSLQQRSQESAPAGVNREQWLASRAKRAAPKPVQQRVGMDEATSAAWNKWMTDYVGKAIGANNKALVKALGEDIVEFVCEYVHKHLETETKKLREEIGSLRADLTIQTGIARGQIAEIKRDVA